MKTEQPLLITSVKAAAETDAFLFVGFDGAVLSSAVKSLGVSHAHTESGEQLPVTVSGIALVLSGDAVSVGAEVESDANGKAVPLDAGVSNGYALDEATGADEVIRVLLK
ncbi:MAG: DUF2190 family protein [Melioribacteraceae bacterium]|nr:MAG: DUF2190 family protein [Melioribacteraceae bacterium]